MKRKLFSMIIVGGLLLTSIPIQAQDLDIDCDIESGYEITMPKTISLSVGQSIDFDIELTKNDLGNDDYVRVSAPYYDEWKGCLPDSEYYASYQLRQEGKRSYYNDEIQFTQHRQMLSKLQTSIHCSIDAPHNLGAGKWNCPIEFYIDHGSMPVTYHPCLGFDIYDETCDISIFKTQRYYGVSIDGGDQNDLDNARIWYDEYGDEQEAEEVFYDGDYYLSKGTVIEGDDNDGDGEPDDYGLDFESYYVCKEGIMKPIYFAEKWFSGAVEDDDIRGIETFDNPYICITPAQNNSEFEHEMSIGATLIEGTLDANGRYKAIPLQCGPRETLYMQIAKTSTVVKREVRFFAFDPNAEEFYENLKIDIYYEYNPSGYGLGNAAIMVRGENYIKKMKVWGKINNRSKELSSDGRVAYWNSSSEYSDENIRLF